MTIDEMSGGELRGAMASSIEKILFLERMLRETREHARAIQGRLLNDPEVRMKPDEGIPTKYGVLKRHHVVKGKAWVVKEEVDKDAGELPEELRPSKDHRVVVEHLSDLTTALQAELRDLAAKEDPVVVLAEKAKYPTVTKLRAAFGKDTRYVGDPPKERMVVLSKGTEDDIALVGIEGLV